MCIELSEPEQFHQDIHRVFQGRGYICGYQTLLRAYRGRRAQKTAGGLHPLRMEEEFISLGAGVWEPAS